MTFYMSKDQENSGFSVHDPFKIHKMSQLCVLFIICSSSRGSSWIRFLSLNLCVSHVASHAWVCVSLSRLSSDVLKGLMSGAQATLPPHLQLAFSGKRWARDAPAACMRAFAAFFIFSRVESQCLILTLSLSLSLCVQMSIKLRAETWRGRPYDITELWSGTDSAHFYAWCAGRPMRRSRFLYLFEYWCWWIMLFV